MNSDVSIELRIDDQPVAVWDFKADGARVHDLIEGMLEDILYDDE